MLLLRHTLYRFIITFIKQQKTHSILTQKFVLNNSEILSYSNVSYILPPLWQVNLEKVLNCFQKLFQSCCIRRSSPYNCQKLYSPFDHPLPTPTLTSPPPFSHPHPHSHIRRVFTQNLYPSPNLVHPRQNMTLFISLCLLPLLTGGIRYTEQLYLYGQSI